MIEQAKPSPKEIALTELLSAKGIPVQGGGFRWDPFLPSPSEGNAVIAVHVTSEQPTDEEIDLIRKIGEQRITRFGLSDKTDILFAPMANTLTLIKKPDGNWGYRKLTWTQGPLWLVAEGSLASNEEILVRT